MVVCNYEYQQVQNEEDLIKELLVPIPESVPLDLDDLDESESGVADKVNFSNFFEEIDL